MLPEARFLLEGIIIGFLISTPVGTVGVLCIRRMLTEGRLVAFVSGLGAAVADAIYALLAAVALTFVSGILGQQKNLLRLGAGVILLFLGNRVFMSKPEVKADTPRVLGLMADFGSIFLLAMSNPMVVLTMAAIFKARDLTIEDGGYTSVASLAVGVCSGSTLWWVILSAAHAWFKVEFSEQGLRWINRIAGAIITAFGMVVLAGLALGMR